MPKKLTRKEFIQKAHKKHFGKYDYRKSVYINTDTKVIITCKLHGDFTQTPHDHCAVYGCPECGKSKPLTTSTFIEKAGKVHNNKYSYSNTAYTISKNKVTITCPIHGDFEQVASMHLYGRGCPHCSYINSKNAFIIKSDKIHNKKYDYSLVSESYSHSKPVTIICPEHGEFMQKPSLHLRGRGCKKCAKSGFKLDKPGTLYYLKLLDTGMYKIGITNNPLNKRFCKAEFEKMEILKTWYYVNGEECLKQEQAILQEFKKFRYKGDKVLSSGNTEIFTIDILNLDISLPIFSK